METLEIAEHLRQVPLFSRLSPTNLERVAAATRVETFPQRSQLFVAGEPGHAFVAILTGEAVVRAINPRGRLRPVGYLRAGDSAGVTSLLLGEPHDATIQATTEVVALVLDRGRFSILRYEHPSLETELSLPSEIVVKLRQQRLPWLEPGEVAVHLGHRHWWALLRMMAPWTLLLAIGTLLLYLLLDAHSPGILFALPVILLVIYALILAWNIVDWRNDYLAVTTQRVVRRELILFTYEARLEAPLNQVQDVTLRRSRVGAVLNFGTLQVQTAAKSGVSRIVFNHLSEPSACAAALSQQVHRAQAQSLIRAEKGVREELQRRLGWATPEELAFRGHGRIASVWERGERRRPSRTPRWRFLAPLREQEGSRIIWRKHWYFLFLRILAPLVANLAWLALLLLVVIGRVLGATPAPLGWGAVIGLLVLGLAVGSWLWWQVTDWENDIYILTDDRIIDIEKRPLFGAEERREASLDRIQNVNLSVPGVVANLLRFGDVNIDTAGGEGQFTFHGVMAPHEVQQEIMRRVAQHREERQQVESQQRRSEIAEWFSVYERLRSQRSQPPPGTTPATTPGT